MIDSRSYRETAPFPFNRDGYSCRRDGDALPAVLLVDIAPNGRDARLHFAGDTHIRTAHVVELMMDQDTLRGLEPLDAFKIGRASSE